MPVLDSPSEGTGADPFSSVFFVDRFRYLKLALAQVAIGGAAYGWYHPRDGLSAGDSVAGYGLGIWSLGLVIWLAWFGIRKRRYGDVRGVMSGGRKRLSLKGWLSAHIYFGITLLVLATLHTGFRFGWDLHTFAFALMVLVIASGIFGVIVYSVVPKRVARNLRVDQKGVSADELMARIKDTRTLRLNTLGLSDAINAALAEGLKVSFMKRSLRDQFLGIRGASPAKALVQRVRDLGKDEPNKDDLSLVLSMLERRARWIDQVRLDRRHRAILGCWLLIHVPLTVGLIVALFLHVIVVLSL
jgi:hypothetical protein